MSGQAQLKTDELIDRLNALLRASPKNVSEFELASLKRDAEAVVRSAPVQGYVALGMIAAIKSDSDESIANHERALRIAPSDFFSNYNFAVSLRVFKRFPECINYAEKSFRIAADAGDRNDAGSLLYRLLHDRLKFIEAREFVEFAPGDEDSIDQNSELSEAVMYMSASGLSDDDLTPFADLLDALVDEAGLRATHTECAVLQEGACNDLLIVRGIVASPSESARLSDSFAERIVASPIAPHVLDRVTCIFRPMSET